MAAERRMRDACGRTLKLCAKPQRIVCLCPSISETVYALVGKHLVGRTRYCIHPETAMAQIATVGGTKNPDIEAILGLQPDLIIAEKEENREEDIEQLALHAPVYVFDVNSVTTAFEMIETLGELLGDKHTLRAQTMVAERRQAWQRLVPITPHQSALYLIWRKPWMAAAGGTYINSVMRELGLQNVLAGQSRYPVLQDSDITQLDPQLVLLSSEPYPFREQHRDEISRLVPTAQVHCVDGELFSWYGKRMLEAAQQLPAMIQSVSLFQR